MCIWVHPTDKTKSTIITSDKTANKIFVYDLNGALLQTISLAWAPGNIDIRYNFSLAGVNTDIVAVNNRTTNTIQIYKVNASTGLLSSAGSINISGVFDDEDYGLAMYRSPYTGDYSVFVVDYKGTVAQWVLFDNSGSVAAVGGTYKRHWETGANATNDIAEGMVCDDETGKLYVSRENYEVAVYSAEPDSSTTKQTSFASIGTNGVKDDIEGITIYYAANGNGYIIFSSQGNSTFKVYDRKPPHNFVKTFTVSGVGSTDGVDVCNVNLGGTFNQGIFLCHDGTTSPYSIRGVKFQDLGLNIDTDYWDPRAKNSPLGLFDDINVNPPKNYLLLQNYPNPFNPNTKIDFNIPQITNVKLSVFNIIGQEVAVLKSGELPAGSYEVNFDASYLSNGVYFYRLTTPSFAITRKMTLLK
jgi:3-phytase